MLATQAPQAMAMSQSVRSESAGADEGAEWATGTGRDDMAEAWSRQLTRRWTKLKWTGRIGGELAWQHRAEGTENRPRTHRKDTKAGAEAAAGSGAPTKKLPGRTGRSALLSD